MLDKRSWKRLEWSMITKRRLTWFEFDDGFCGALEMLEVSEPFRVGKSRLAICDQGITWIQCAWQKKNLWATAMFDSSGQLFQIYFDAADEVHLDKEDSWFVDLIADVVYDPAGYAEIIDLDELAEMYEKGRISLAQKQLAERTCFSLKKELESHCDEVNLWFEQLYKKVKKIL